ncbi:DUF882 domain-containing protein [Micavibrio aeruginosavorus]|uniref:DUF882 domain-containing protein n=1 Tax=Micavibrio aeruginosavorus TaxID=349221 RepID=UPI003F4A8BFF
MTGAQSNIHKNMVRVASTLTLGCALAFNSASAAPAEQSLHLHNVHTKESINVVYKRNGQYVPAALTQINVLLRDHRAHGPEAVHPINPRTLDRLYDIGQKAKRNYPHIKLEFVINSGHRLSASNEMLRKASRERAKHLKPGQDDGGPAKSSAHTRGNAIDFSIPGLPTTTARDLAWCTGSGGVGYYKNDGMVHIDAERKRFWPANWNPAHVNCEKFK